MIHSLSPFINSSNRAFKLNYQAINDLLVELVAFVFAGVLSARVKDKMLNEKIKKRILR